jgi:hypothetical protein
MLLNYRNCRTFDQLMRILTQALKLPTGQIRKIYDAISYERLTNLHMLRDGHNIIAVTHETLKKIPYEVVDLHFKPAKPADVYFFSKLIYLGYSYCHIFPQRRSLS